MGKRKRAVDKVQADIDSARNELEPYELKRKQERLASQCKALYTETDKLCKKAPKEPVTELQLRKINSLLEKAKQLMKGDEFIDETAKFVPAGENPEYRDALIVLAEVSSGLGRFKQQHSELWDRYAYTEAEEAALRERLNELGQELEGLTHGSSDTEVGN